MTMRNLFARTILCLFLTGCGGSVLPPGANYVSPFSNGIAPARLYAANVRTISGSLTAYNLLPICTNDFKMAKELLALTSSPTLNYGTLTVTDGPSILAGLSGLPVNSFLTASGGLGYSDRNTMSFSNAQLVQVDNEGAPAVIANYIKRRGHGTAEKPSCLDIVESSLKNGLAIVVTKGIISSNNATITPEASLGSASCGGSDSSGSASATVGSAKITATGAKPVIASTGGNTLNINVGQSGTPATSTQSGTTESKPAGDAKPAKQVAGKPGAPVSGCVGISLAKTVSFTVKGEGGAVYTQSVDGAVIAILPASLPL